MHSYVRRSPVIGGVLFPQNQQFLPGPHLSEATPLPVVHGLGILRNHEAEYIEHFLADLLHSFHQIYSVSESLS